MLIVCVRSVSISPTLAKKLFGVTIRCANYISVTTVIPFCSKMVYIIIVIKGAKMQLTPIASNMTEIETDSARVLFSYRTPVAAYVFGVGFIKTDKFWSVTTSRHINKWLDGGTPREVSQTYLDNLV